MQKFGYKSNNTGICFGFAHMGMQAILSGGIESFDERLDAIVTDIAQGYILTEKERNLNRITHLLDGVELYFQASLYPHLFEKGKAPKTQSALLVAPLVMSIEIENQGGLEKSSSFSGVYNEKALIDYFESLRTSIENAQPPYEKPVALVLNNVNHAISVGFDPIKKQWIFIDANNIPTKYFSSVQDIAKSVVGGFNESSNPDEKVIFTTSAYATHDNNPDFKKVIDDWKSSAPWKSLHEISSEKFKAQDQSGGSWLLSAARDSQVEVVSKLLESKADPNLGNENNFTPLHMAAQEGHLDVARQLLKHDANPMATQLNESSPLHVAAFNGNALIAKELLKIKTVDPNKKNVEGVTPLLGAVNKGHLDVVMVLLDSKDVEPNLASSTGMTPLMTATVFGFEDIATALMQNEKTDVNREVDGFTPLQCATENGSLNMVRALLSNNAETNQTNPNGRSPLFIAAIKGDIKILNELLRNGADPNLATINGVTPLMAAINKGHVDIVKALLKHKDTDPNQAKIDGSTALHSAVFFGNTTIVKKLLSRKASPNKAMYDGMTPLHIAAIHGQTELLKELLLHQADPNMLYKGKCALHFAAKNGHLDVVKELLYHPSINPFLGESLLQVNPKENQEAITNLIKSTLSLESTKYTKPKSSTWMFYDKQLPVLQLIRSYYIYMDKKVEMISNSSAALIDKFNAVLAKKDLLEFTKKELKEFYQQFKALEEHWIVMKSAKSSFIDNFTSVKDNRNLKEWDDQFEKTISQRKADYDKNIQPIMGKLSESLAKKESLASKRSKALLSAPDKSKPNPQSNDTLQKSKTGPIKGL